MLKGCGLGSGEVSFPFEGPSGLGQGTDWKDLGWKPEVPVGDDGDRTYGGTGWGEDDLVTCSRGYFNRAGGEGERGEDDFSWGGGRGVFVKSATRLLSPTPVPAGSSLALPASVFMGKAMRWEGRAGGDRGCAGGCRLRLCLPAFLSAAAAVSGRPASAPAVAAGRAGSRCGASGGGLHADGQMDNETEWMRATHTLLPSLLSAHKSRDKEAVGTQATAAQHTHAADKDTGWGEAGTPGTRRAGGEAPVTSGKTS